jgi:NTE family protein
MTIKNLVFEGGGVRGIAYGGAINQLYKMNLYTEIENVAGSSAGAISACLLSLGAKPYHLPNLLSEIDFSDFEDNSFGVVRDLFRFINQYGWNKGEEFYKWLEYQITEISDLPKNATLLDLHEACVGPDLHVVATDITWGKSVIFNYENYPNIKIADAVRASMAFPFFFTPIKIDGSYYVDGGLLNNFPVKIFKDIECTIGFNLCDDQEVLEKETNKISKIPINNIIGFAKSIFFSVYTNLQQTKINDFSVDKIININIGDIPVLKFKLSDEEIESLISAGENSVLRYFGEL